MQRAEKCLSVQYHREDESITIIGVFPDQIYPAEYMRLWDFVNSWIIPVGRMSHSTNATKNKMNRCTQTLQDKLLRTFLIFRIDNQNEFSATFQEQLRQSQVCPQIAWWREQLPRLGDYLLAVPWCQSVLGTLFGIRRAPGIWSEICESGKFDSHRQWICVCIPNNKNCSERAASACARIPHWFYLDTHLGFSIVRIGTYIIKTL